MQFARQCLKHSFVISISFDLIYTVIGPSLPVSFSYSLVPIKPPHFYEYEHKENKPYVSTGCLEKKFTREILNKTRSFVCTHLIFASVYLKVGRSVW